MSHAPLIFSHFFKENPQTSLGRHDSAGCTSRRHLADMSHVSQQDSPSWQTPQTHGNPLGSTFSTLRRQVPQTCQFHTFCPQTSADIRRHPQTSADTDKQRFFWVNPYGDVSASTFAARRLRRACRRSHAQRRHQRNSLMRFSRLETREVPCQDRQPFASKMQVVRQVHLIPTQLFTPGIRHFLVGSRNQRETM